MQPGNSVWLVEIKRKVRRSWQADTGLIALPMMPPACRSQKKCDHRFGGFIALRTISRTAHTITNANRNTIPRLGYSLKADNDGIIVTWKGWDDVTYESNKVPWPSEGAATSNSFNLADYLDQTDPKFQGIDIPISYSVNEYATDAE